MKPETDCESVIIKRTIQGQAPIIKHQEDKIPYDTWFDQPVVYFQFVLKLFLLNYFIFIFCLLCGKSAEGATAPPAGD